MAELKHGILTETVLENGETKETLLKEFEVLPATAGLAIAIVSESSKNGTDFNKIMYRERIKIKDLPSKAWNISVLEQLSIADFLILKEEIEKFDEVFTFTPPKIRV
jgi:hypothetical protein